MSKYLLPTGFRTHLAQQLKESITEQANSVYYVFAGKHTSYANGTIPQPADSLQDTLLDSFDDMVFGKKVNDSDVALLIPKVEWVSNTVYDHYTSNSVVFGNNFYVAVNATSQYNIFKCLDNADGLPSTYAPTLADTSPSDEYYSTADNYVWKYMYSVSSSVWNKFTTEHWMPVVANTQVSGNAVPGSIDIINVNQQGSNYDTFLAGQFASADIAINGDPLLYTISSSANTADNFYNQSAIYITEGAGKGQIRRIEAYNGTYRRITVNSAFTTTLSSTSQYEIGPLITISGDGSGAVARGLVNSVSSNSMYKVEVVNRGTGYSYATLTITGNTSGVSNAAVLSPSIAPPGGHGFDAYKELGATAIGIGVSFANTESGTIPTSNDFRTIGIIKDPLFANVTFSLNASSISGVFTPGETITQATSNAYGVVTSIVGATLAITNAYGTFQTGKVVTGGTSSASGNVISFDINNMSKDFNTFDQRSRYVVSYLSGTFQADEPVYQNNISLANGVFHSNDATYLSLTNVKGVFNTGQPIVGNTSAAQANVTGYTPPDLVKNAGDIIYIENIDPVSRSNTQTETIKIVLKF